MSLDILGNVARDTAVLRARLATLTRQSADGLRSPQLGDLGPEVPRLISLRGEVARREAYSRSMDQALGRTGVMQEALGRLTAIAREFHSTVTTRITSLDPHSLATVQAQARAALTEVAHLLNTQHAGEYLFGGTDLARAPVPDPEGLATGQMAQDVATAIGNLGTADAATVSAATKGVAQSTTAGITPFSAFLTADEALAAADREARRGVPSADGEVIGYGIKANANAAATSAGETTGSWARDLMRGLMSLAALTPAQMTASPLEFDRLVGTIRDGFRSAETALGEEAGALGHVEARMQTARARHGQLSAVMESQLADIQYVDMAETLSLLQATKTTLEASYRAIGTLSELRLVNFLR
nr:flagellin [uncultured Roseococcus sp.]